MGVDFLDLVCRIETEFDITVQHAELDELFLRHDPPDVTAGQLYVFVCSKCREAGIPVPHSTWNRLKLVIWRSGTGGARIGDIRKGSLLRRGLGFA
jgi:hypothetical protein